MGFGFFMCIGGIDMWTKEDFDNLEQALKNVRDYEQATAERNKYLIPDVKEKSDCMHDNCPNCHGTGINKLGGMCVHGISCPCSKCRTYC